jgi:hypothetical protein
LELGRAQLQCRILQNESFKPLGCPRSAIILGHWICLRCLPLSFQTWIKLLPWKCGWHTKFYGGNHTVKHSWRADCIPLTNEWRNYFTSAWWGRVGHWADPTWVGSGWPSSLVKTTHSTTLEKLVVSWNCQTSKRK